MNFRMRPIAVTPVSPATMEIMRRISSFRRFATGAERTSLPGVLRNLGTPVYHSSSDGFSFSAASLAPVGGGVTSTQEKLVISCGLPSSSSSKSVGCRSETWLPLASVTMRSTWRRLTSTRMTGFSAAGVAVCAEMIDVDNSTAPESSRSRGILRLRSMQGS